MTGSPLIEAICGELLRDADELTQRIVVRIRREFPAYAAVADEEQLDTVIGEIRNALTGFRDRRPPTVADAQHGELLGRRRAEQGIPIEIVLRAYHSGYDIMWNELHARVVARDPAREVDLLPVVGTMMTWLRSITGRVAEGYEAVTAARQESRLALAQVFVTGLAQGNAGSEAVEAAARGLGFDPTGPFEAICAPAGAWPPEALHRLRRAVRPPVAVTVVGHTLAVIVQNVSVASVLAQLGERPVAGVGLSRPGLAGAAESLTDAERALALAEQREAVVHFEQDWLLATLLPQATRLAPLIGARGAENHAHLAEAVRAYAEHQFSITGGATALHVHANTLKYRLTRWQQITGWDPRTLDGLMRSLVSLAAQAR